MEEASEAKIRILILGGGFAGIQAMMSLEKHFSHTDEVEITLVSEENFWLFTPLLSEVAIGVVDPRHILIPIRELCRKTHFHRAVVTHIDLVQRQVGILYNGLPQCPDVLAYDQLVLALGSVSNMALVPGVAEYAWNFKEIGDALALRNHLMEMFEQADTEEDARKKEALLTFTVIGGGYSGVEVAAAIRGLAERIIPLYPTLSLHNVRVMILEAADRLLGTMPLELSRYAQQVLQEMGVEVRLNTRVNEVRESEVIIWGDRLSACTAIWTTGVVVPDVVMGLPVSKDSKGRPMTTPELYFEAFPEVWGVGDNVMNPMPEGDGFYPPTAQVAVRQGDVVACNIHRVLQGKAPQAFRFEQKGEMVVLGEFSAVALVYGHKIKGFVAWLLWRTFYLSRLPRWKKRVRVGVDWLLSLFGPIETTQIKVDYLHSPAGREILPRLTERAIE